MLAPLAADNQNVDSRNLPGIGESNHLTAPTAYQHQKGFLSLVSD